MIRCIKTGIISWNFDVHGGGHQASLEFNWLSERGAITVDGQRYDVRKHGIFSGHWTLNRADVLVASAQKGFTRFFDIQAATDALILRAESPFGFGFSVSRSGNVVATIAPMHAFTHRTSIEVFDQTLDFATVSFMFWLVVLTWRRTAGTE